VPGAGPQPYASPELASTRIPGGSFVAYRYVEEFEDLTRRLGALGRHPVDRGLADRHMAMMASVQVREARRRRVHPALAGALLAGTILGGGVAGAVTGTLPDPAQDAVHNVLSKVGVDVPEGDRQAGKGAGQFESPAAGSRPGSSAGSSRADENGGSGVGGPEERGPGAATGTERVDCGPLTGNHGRWVVAHWDDPATPDRNEREEAARADCGKPERAVSAPPHGGHKQGGAGKPDAVGKPAEPETRRQGGGRPSQRVDGQAP
jgi:hypothetical protein